MSRQNRRERFWTTPKVLARRAEGRDLSRRQDVRERLGAITLARCLNLAYDAGVSGQNTGNTSITAKNTTIVSGTPTLR